ncbi:MAG: ABC transporter permease [Casimicrobiaceae bacterium]|nr:ABC transporter permease [Casimicrobiaceae bacterium]MCX8097837.1 ABC transporter permease [Casimicrobiaceae bacterium]MDW8311373.1 ABC transporter permease [Burkholderiales bacterium]
MLRSLRNILDSDLWWSFTHSPLTVAAALVALLCVLGAILAPVLAPHNPYDLAQVSLANSNLPPAFLPGGSPAFPLGTDQQGRDILSTILYGSRISLLVAFSATLMSMLIGVTLGLVAGYVGGRLESFIMRLADIQLSFPAILIALLISGIGRTVLPREAQEQLALYVIILSIGLTGWVQYARTVRGSTLVEKNKEYVQAARLIGVPRWRIMLYHVLPNALGPVLVIATLGMANAILTEATLSFLGVGMPPTQPSLGTLINEGQNYLFSGEWWITIFPGIALVVMVISVNLLGDWLRDALNPKLR